MSSECKLVPYHPTPEMVEAAEDAHMPFGDMDMALRMAILAAPEHQAEQEACPDCKGDGINPSDPDKVTACIHCSGDGLIAHAPPAAPDVSGLVEESVRLLMQAFDALESMTDSDIDDFEDEEEEAEAVPAQYACRKIMRAIDALSAHREQQP